MRNMIEQRYSLNTKVCKRLLEYGESKEGLDIQFIAQMHRAIAIKYPMEDGWCHVWIFDHSSCHATMADNAS